MRIHDTLVPLDDAPPSIKSLINQGQFLGDGAYSRVFAKSEYQALKVTCCKATITMMRELYELAQGKAVPLHLPLIYECLGPVATDADGLTFHGFIIERLFEPEQYRDRLLARQAMRAAGIQDRGCRNITLTVDESWQRFSSVRESLDQAWDEHYRFERAGWSESATLAGYVASFNEVCLLDAGPTFTFLETFVVDTRYELDLNAKGNLLVSAYGLPILADPVAEIVSPVDASAPGEFAFCGFAMMELRPVSVGPSTTELQWHTLDHAESPAEADAFIAKRRAEFPHAAEHQVVRWRDSAHRALVEQQGLTRPVAELSKATIAQLLGPAAKRHPDLAGIKLSKRVRKVLAERFSLRASMFIQEALDHAAGELTSKEPVALA